MIDKHFNPELYTPNFLLFLYFLKKLEIEEMKKEYFLFQS